MPELPEVESVRRGLERRLVGCVITAAELRRRDVLIAPGDPTGGFSRQRGRGRILPVPIDDADLLIGCRVTEVRRLGKQIAIVARQARSDARALGVQLGMTGHMEVLTLGAPIPDAHVHAVWTIDSSRVIFHDPRRFGGLRVFRSLAALDEHWAALGPDALTIGSRVLSDALRHSKRAIKAALLDQSVLAGVGNIYADEALFRAGIHPAARADRLRGPAAEDLASRIREVLQEAVAAGGSSVRDYADAEGARGSYQLRHRVYGRSGQPCVACGRTLQSDLLAQRTTVWCGRCQRRGR